MIVALVSAGAGGAVFMGELGRKGNSHARWNKICDKFESFCDHGAGAFIACFIGLLLLMIINVISILNLRNHLKYSPTNYSALPWSMLASCMQIEFSKRMNQWIILMIDRQAIHILNLVWLHVCLLITFLITILLVWRIVLQQSCCKNLITQTTYWWWVLQHVKWTPVEPSSCVRFDSRFVCFIYSSSITVVKLELNSNFWF